MNDQLPDMGSLALIAVAGGTGAVARYTLDGVVLRAIGARGPLGIFVVNVLASVAMGVLTGTGLAFLQSQLGLVLAAGLLGGFSTLSTVAVDSARLAQTRRWGWLLLHTAGMLALSVAACAGAHAVTSALIG
jgi:CrcB protein